MGDVSFGGGGPAGARSVAVSGEDTRGLALRRRALIVEDELFIAMHLESVLEDLGVDTCEVAATAAEALEYAARFQPDFIVMDVNLRGDMDGVETARRAIANHHARIIFVTAYGDPKTLDRIREVSPNSPVVQKPAVAATVAAAIRAVFAN